MSGLVTGLTLAGAFLGAAGGAVFGVMGNMYNMMSLKSGPSLAKTIGIGLVGGRLALGGSGALYENWTNVVHGTADALSPAGAFKNCPDTIPADKPFRVLKKSDGSISCSAAP